MDVDDVVRIRGVEVDKEMLAKGLGKGDTGAADQRGLRGEPTLRAAHGQGAAAEVGIERAGEAVNDMSLRHREKFTRPWCSGHAGVLL